VTLPNERYRAVIQTREFLVSLITPSETPRIPSHVRSTARLLLRHYPGILELEEAAYAAPSVFEGESTRRREEQTFMVDVAERLAPPRRTWWELLGWSRRTDDVTNEPGEG
jgi:hypothetical protein